MRLLLLSEDPVSLDELEAKLRQRLPAIRVIGKCYSWADGVQAAQQLHPDVVVVDEAIEDLNKVFGSVLKAHCHIVAWLTRNDAAAHDVSIGGVSLIGGEAKLLLFLESIS